MPPNTLMSATCVPMDDANVTRQTPGSVGTYEKAPVPVRLVHTISTADGEVNVKVDAAEGFRNQLSPV